MPFMYGAWGLPMISDALWFSITIVNTVPVHCAGRWAAVALNARHSAVVFPATLGFEHPAPTMAELAMTRATERMLMRIEHASLHADRGGSS
jgi:hypothetical protein